MDGVTTRYRKKPVVVEAFQMTKKRRWDNSDWPEWANRAWQTEPGEGSIWIDPDDLNKESLVCGTLEGVHRIDWNDWIIQGIKKELYPCKPDIFEATYELIEYTDAVEEIVNSEEVDKAIDEVVDEVLK